VKKTDLKSLFKESWVFVWENPILWFLGFFAAFFSNNEIISLVRNYKKINDWINQLVVLKLFHFSFKNLFSVLPDFLNSNVSFVVLATSLGILLFILSFLSQISLVLSAADGQKTSFKQSWRRGKAFLWLVIGLYLLILIVIYGLLALFSIPWIFKHLVVAVPVFVFLLLGIIISFVSRYAIFFIILRKNKLFKSIKNGFLFFIKNWLITLKTSFFVFLVMLSLGLIISLVSVGTAIPFMVMVDFFLRFDLTFFFWLISGIYALSIIISVLFLSSVFSAWQTSVWVSLFSKLSSLYSNSRIK